MEHTHTSYPVGHLSTMFWIGMEPGDVHLNVASPGWAKHAWSNVFTPWIAEACVFIYNYERFDAKALMEQMDRERVTSFCAPPTVWRMLIQADLTLLKNPPTKVVSAGEPLNAEVIDQVNRAWGQTIRDGFGQTETTVQIANTPGQPIKIGAMGKPLPGYDVVLVDPATGEEADDGELCLRLDPRPVGLMKAYYGDPEKTAEAFRDGYYHTGDMASRDERGIITYVGRGDDVFKSSDYRLSPFELESVLIEHPAVAEAAVVPSPDPLKLSVPKAFVVLAAGHEPGPELAEDILRYCREHLAPFKRIRRLEFAELPKTISGKIRRVELRHNEELRHGAGDVPEGLGIGVLGSRLPRAEGPGLGMGAPLPRDPIADAQRNWERHGWADVAAPMAAITADHADPADPAGPDRDGAQAVRTDLRTLRTAGPAQFRPQRRAADEQGERVAPGAPHLGDQRRGPAAGGRAGDPVTASHRRAHHADRAHLGGPHARQAGDGGAQLGGVRPVRFRGADVDQLIRILGNFRRDAGDFSG